MLTSKRGNCFDQRRDRHLRTQAASLAGLGADVLIPLDEFPENLTATFRREIRTSGVSVILDYLWGSSAQCLIAAMTGKGGGEAEPGIRSVQIGAVASPMINLPAALGSSGLELTGSDLESASNAALLTAIGQLMQAASTGHLTTEVEPRPLAEVQSAWDSPATGRVVFCSPSKGGEALFGQAAARTERSAPSQMRSATTC